MKPCTTQCDVEWIHIQRFRNNRTFWEESGSGIPDASGNMIPWALAFQAKNGCELTQMRGFADHHCQCTEETRELRVLTIGGPNEVAIGSEAKYRVTTYNKIPSDSEKDKIKWNVEVTLKNGILLEVVDCQIYSHLFKIGRGKMTINNIPVKWSHSNIKVFAYLDKPSQNIHATTNVKFKQYVIAESKNQPRIGDDWAHGDYDVNKYKSISSAFAGDDDLLAESESQLLDRMQNLISTFSSNDKSCIATKMFVQFKTKKGGDFTNNDLTQMAQKHTSTTAFSDKLKHSINNALKTNILIYNEKLNRSGWPRITYGDSDDRDNGLKILVNAVWAYSIELTDFEMLNHTKYAYAIKLKLYDHFGLDANDVKKYGHQFNNDAPTFGAKFMMALKPSIGNGFRSWFILQHIKNYPSILTKIEFTQKMQDSQ